MKKTIIIFIIIGFSVDLISQELNRETIVDLYNQTFMDFFSKKASSTESIEFFIQTDSSQINIQTDFDDFKIHFVTEEESKRLIKKNKISELYWTKINEISKDTIDLKIGGWTVDYKRKFFNGNFTFAAWSGGTSGYVPQGRFIYNHKTQNWKFNSEKEILDRRITEYQDKLKE